MIDVQYAAKALNGRKTGPNRIQCPAPGKTKKNTTLVVWLDDKHAEGFSVYSHSGDDWKGLRDYVRDTLGLPAWTPDPKFVQPVFEAEEYTYQNDKGEDYHRVTILSDKSVRHRWYEIDGWTNGAPDMFYPYRLAEVAEMDTVWLVSGESNADLIADGFGETATTFPSGIDDEPDASFLFHLAGKDVRILHAGGAKSARFVDRFSKALDVPIWHLPENVTLRDFAQREDASLRAASVADELTPATTEPENPFSITPTPYVHIEGEQIPPREWLYDNHLIRKFVSLTVSPGGLGKSSLALIEALSMTSGREIFADAKLHEPEPLRVWYWNGEDPQEETQRRVTAAARHYGLKGPDFATRLFTDSGREQRITMGQISRGEIEIVEDLFLALEHGIIANKIDVFVLDPFVSAHRMGENDNNAIDAVVKRLGTLADRCNCAVEIVHHVRKPSAGSTAVTDINDARGASALVGGVRSGRVLSVMSEEIATAAGISSDLRARHFCIVDGKANMSPSMGDARWRFLESVCLNNQTETRKADNVGVVTYFKLPEAARVMADLSQAEASATRILRSSDTVRHWLGKGKKPKNWLGHLILDDLSIHDGDHDATLQKLITGWIKDGIFTVRTAYEENNRTAFLTIPNGVSEALDTNDDAPF